MTRKATLSPDHPALEALFGAIAARDRDRARELLAETPALARQATTVGATRQQPGTHFFESIAHYAYAGDTPLHLAAAAHDLEIARDLIARGAEVGARNRRGAAPLHYASDGHPQSSSWNPEDQAAMVRLLINAGADPNAEDVSGVAPIHRAVRTRSAAAVRSLLAQGADPFRRNGSGSTPLHLAVQNTGRGGSGTSAARAQQEEIIAVLLQHGARPTDRNALGRTVRESVGAEWILELLR